MLALTKEHGAADLSAMTGMAVGASWDPTQGSSGGVLGWAKRKRGVDLDLLAVVFQGNEPVAFAGLDSLDPLGNGSVVHTGDNQTGAGAGDDEAARVDFGSVPPVYDKIVFVAAAFKNGTSFEKANNVRFTVYDSTGGTDGAVATIPNSLLGNHNAYAVAKAYRENGVWKLQVLGEKGTIRQADKQSLLRFALDKGK
jgi:tellurium resistance protein TerZ